MANQDFFVNLKFKLEDLSKDITKGAASNFLNEVRKISQELKKLDIQNIPEFKEVFQMGGKIKIDLDFNENELKKINTHLEEIRKFFKEFTTGEAFSKYITITVKNIENFVNSLKEIVNAQEIDLKFLKQLSNNYLEISNIIKNIENFANALNKIPDVKKIDLSFLKQVITEYQEAIKTIPTTSSDENITIKFLENIFNFISLIRKIGIEINNLQGYKFPEKRVIRKFFENFNFIFENLQEFHKTLRADFLQLIQIENLQSLTSKEKEAREFIISRLELFVETFTRITNIVSNSFPHLLRTFTTYKDDINNYIEIIVNFIKQFNTSNLAVVSESELENIKKIFSMLSEILQELSKVNETIYTPGKYINTDVLLRDLRNFTEIIREIELIITDLQNINKVNQIKINKLDIIHLFTIIDEITKEVENFLKNNNFDSVISGDILKKWEGIDTFLANLTSILKKLSNFKTIKINNQQAENLLEGFKILLKISQELSSLKTTIQSNLNTDESFFTQEDIENLGRIGVILRDLSFFIQNLFDIISNTSIQNFDDIVPKIEKYFNIIRAVLQRIADIIPYINTIYQNLNTGVKLGNFTDFNTFLNSFIYNIDTSNEELKEIINRNTNFNNTLRGVSNTTERTIQELKNWKELLKGRVINEFQEIFLGSYDLNKILSEYLGRFPSIRKLDFSKFNLDVLTKLKEILVGADINNPQLVRAIFNNLKNTLRKIGIYLKNTGNINEMKQILSEWEQAIRGLFVSGFSQVNLKLISEHRKTLDYYLNQLDRNLDKELPNVLFKIRNILLKYYRTLGYKSKYEIINAFKSGIGVEEIVSLGLSKITNKTDKQELEKLNRRLQSIIENANKAESRIENVLKQVKIQKGLSFSDEDLHQLDRVLQHLTWKTFQVSWGFIYINMTLDKAIFKIKDFLRDVIQTSRELQLIQIRLKGLSEQTSKFASYSQQEFKELMAISAKTPYTIRDIAEAWTQFKALGIDNIKIFKDTIDTAVTFGIEVSKIADDVARAIQGDATAFKNLRHSIGLTNVVIKQFGGSVDESGRLSNKTFKDIKSNAEALMKYLQRYSGASEKTISTLSQAITNLQDIVNIFYAKTAENLTGLGDYLGKITLSILNVYRTQEGLLNELSKTFGTFLLMITGSIPAVEGLSKAFIIFNDIVFMFMTGISSFGMSLTVLPKFLNNTQRAIKELSLAMGVSVKQAESLVNMYRNLHKVVASSSFEIFEIFMNNVIAFALNLVNFAVNFIKKHFLGILIAGLGTILMVYTRNTELELERRKSELQKIQKLLSEDLVETIIPEISEESYNFYEILKKIADISDKLVQNFSLTEEKAFTISKNFLLQQSSIEDIYKYMLQLSYLKPFKFTINIQEYIDRLEDFKQAMETFNQTPTLGIQQNIVRSMFLGIIYYILEKNLRESIKKFSTRKPPEELPIDFRQEIFTPKYYEELIKILDLDTEKLIFSSVKLETRLLINQIQRFLNMFKSFLVNDIFTPYISNLERELTDLIKKEFPQIQITNLRKLEKEILDKLSKSKEFQRLYKEYNLIFFLRANIRNIDNFTLLAKKYLQILPKISSENINISEMFKKVQLFKKDFSYLNYNLREFFRNFTTSTEIVSGINKFIKDISEIKDTEELIKFLENKYKLLKGQEIDIRKNILSKLEGKIEKFIIKNEDIDLVVKMIEQRITEILRTHTREVISNYPEVLNRILNEIIERLINSKLIEETHRKEVEKIIKTALFGNTISNIIFILRKGVINLSDEVKQVLLEALNKIEMDEVIKREISQSIESGIIILTKENRKTLKYIIKNIKNINKYYQELSKLQFPEDLDKIPISRSKEFFHNFIDIIQRTPIIIRGGIKNLNNYIKGIINNIFSPKTIEDIPVDITQDIPENITKVFRVFSENINKISLNLKTFAQIIEDISQKFQDIRLYGVLQNIRNRILGLRLPLQGLNLISDTIERQRQEILNIEKNLIRLGIRRFIRGEVKLGPILSRIATSWDNTIEAGLTAYERNVIGDITKKSIKQKLLTFSGKVLRYIANAFLKIGAILFNIAIDFIDAFIGAFYISKKTGELWIKSFSERFSDTLTGIILGFLKKIFSFNFWKNLFSNLWEGFKKTSSKIAEFLWGGTIQKIIEQQERKKLQKRIKEIIIGDKALSKEEQEEITKTTKQIEKIMIKEPIKKLQEALKEFNKNLQNIDIEEFNYATQDYLNNIYSILVNTKFITKSGEVITLEKLLEEQVEDITQLKILWGSILESVKAYNDTIDEAINLINKLYKNTFTYRELETKYFDELLRYFEKEEKSISELIEEDLKKLEDITKKIEDKKSSIINKLKNLKIDIDFKTTNFNELINKIKEKTNIKFQVELREDIEASESIKRIREFINVLENTYSLTNEQITRLREIYDKYKELKSKTEPSDIEKFIIQEIERYFTGEEIFSFVFIQEKDLDLRERINYFQKEGINLQEEINNLQEEYNELLNNTQFNINKIAQKIKELADLSLEIKNKTKGFEINFVKNLLDNTRVQLKEIEETQSIITGYFDEKIKELDNKIKDSEEKLKKLQKEEDKGKTKEAIENLKQEIEGYKKSKQLHEDIVKQLYNKQSLLKKNLSLYEEEYKKFKDTYDISQLLDKNLNQSLKQIIDFNKNLRNRKDIFENKDITLLEKVKNILQSMKLDENQISNLLGQFFDKSGEITEKGILFIKNIFNEYYKDEKEYYNLQKEYINRNFIGLQKNLAITQLIKEVEKDSNLTLEEKQDLIKELLDTQLEELDNLTNYYNTWGKLKEIFKSISNDSTLTDKQKLDLTNRLIQKSEEYLDLTKNIYEYETFIDEILKQQLVKGVEAIKLDREKYQKMLDIIKDYEIGQKKIAYKYILNKIITDTLLPKEIKEKLKEDIYKEYYDIIKEYLENQKELIDRNFFGFQKITAILNLIKEIEGDTNLTLKDRQSLILGLYKEYFNLQKEYINRNLIGLQKFLAITQLINEVEYNTNLTLEERQDLINELLDLQLEELKNITDIYIGWSKIKELIRTISNNLTLTDKQKLDLTNKLIQKTEEYLNLTKNIYEYETSIDEILRQQLVKGLEAIKLNKEKYEKMLDVIKDYKEDKKIEGYIYVLNKVITDNLLPPEVIEELKERIYNDLFNTQTFENHFQKIKEKFIETFKDEKLFNLERVLNPKKIGEFIQNYFKKNNIKINIDFKSDAFKKLIKELGDSLIQIFKEKIDELKGVIEDLRSKFNIPKQEESGIEKLEKLYQQGIITYDEYMSAKSAAGILKTAEEQEKKGGMTYNETVLEWNRNIIGDVLNKAEKRLKQKEEELKAQETKATADFNTSVNTFATAVKNFENAVSALGGLIASLGKGGGVVGGTTQNNQNQQTNQTNVNQTNVNNNINIINNLPSGSVYFPFLGPTE